MFAPVPTIPREERLTSRASSARKPLEIIPVTKNPMQPATRQKRSLISLRKITRLKKTGGGQMKTRTRFVVRFSVFSVQFRYRHLPGFD